MTKKILIIIVLILLFPLVVLWTSGKWPTLTKPPFFVPQRKEQPKDTEVISQPVSIHFWKTSKNVPVYFIPTEQLPMVDVAITFDAGSARDGKKFGLSMLHSSLLDEGTLQHQALDIAQQFENVGAVFDTDTQRDEKTIKLRSLAEADILLPMIDLFSEILTQPAFSETTVEQLKNRMLITLETEFQQPNTLASTAFYKAVYDDHPYGHLVSGTPDTLSSITRQDLLDFHKEFIVANNAIITIVGGIHRDYAKEISEKISDALPKGKTPAPLPNVEAVKSASDIYLPINSTQTHVLLGAACCTMQDSDFFSILVGNYILGEGPLISRLFNELRDKRGLVYNVSSRFQRLKKPGVFVIDLQTKKGQSQEAIQIVQNTLAEFINEGPTEEEVAAAKKGIIGAFPLSIGNNSRLADVISDMSFYDLPIDFLKTYRDNVEKVTRQDIQTVFRRRIDPNKLVLVVVGEQKP